MHLFPLIKTRAQHRTKQRNRIPGSITVLVHRVHRAQKVLPCQGHQANVIEGALGCSTSSSYKSSASSSSSPSGKYVGNGRFLQWSLYAGSVESLTWGNKEKILTHKWYQLWYLKLPLIKNLFLCVWTGMQPLHAEVINDSTVASLCILLSLINQFSSTEPATSQEWNQLSLYTYNISHVLNCPAEWIF